MPGDSAADAERLAQIRKRLSESQDGDAWLLSYSAASFLLRLIDSRDAALREARAEIEDWRGRFSTSLGETLAARMERDSLRAAALAEYDAAPPDVAAPQRELGDG